MSLEKIVEEALAGRPLEMKEAFEEAIQARVLAALEQKYAEMNGLDEDEDLEDLEESEDDEDEDEDDMDESFAKDLSKKMRDFYRKGHEENHNKYLSLAMSGSRTSDHNGHEGSYVQHRNAAEEHKGTPAGKHHAAAAASHDAAADHLDKYKKSGDVKHLNTAVKHSEAAVEHSKKADKAGGTNTDSHLVHSDTKSVMFHHKGMKE
jgi:hypothetical protein